MKELLRRGVISKVGSSRPGSAYVHLQYKPPVAGYPCPVAESCFVCTPAEAECFREGDAVTLKLEIEPS